jgi:hypothetical protein
MILIFLRLEVISIAKQMIRTTPLLCRIQRLHRNLESGSTFARGTRLEEVLGRDLEILIPRLTPFKGLNDFGRQRPHLFMDKLRIWRKGNNISWPCFRTQTTHDNTGSQLVKIQKNLNFVYTTSRYGNYSN